MLIGFVPIVPIGPSLGTPIFRSGDDEPGDYIQSSSEEQTIESFIMLPNSPSKTTSFVRVRPNTPFAPGSEFVVGFRDFRNFSHVYAKSDLIAKVTEEFFHYHHLPFLQWNMISVFKLPELISKMTDENLELICMSQIDSIPANKDAAKININISTLIAPKQRDEIEIIPDERVSMVREYFRKRRHQNKLRLSWSDYKESSPRLLEVLSWSKAIQNKKAGLDKSPREALRLLREEFLKMCIARKTD